AGTIGLPVRQRVAHLLVPRHRPDAVMLQPHHGAGLAHRLMMRIGIVQELMRERIDPGRGTFDDGIHGNAPPPAFVPHPEEPQSGVSKDEARLWPHGSRRARWRASP